MWQVKWEEKPEHSWDSWLSSRVNSATIYWNEVGFEEIAKERNKTVCGPAEFNVNISVWGFKEKMTAFDHTNAEYTSIPYLTISCIYML